MRDLHSRAAQLVKDAFERSREREIEIRAESWPQDPPADANADSQAWAYVLAVLEERKPPK